MLSNGILDIEETEGEEISLTAEGPQLTEEERLRIESEKEDGDDKEEKRIDLFSSAEEDPLNSLLLGEDGITTLFQAKDGGNATKNIKGQPHMLAYITPGEAKTLENLGGQKTMTKEGIPAYPPSDNYGGNWGGGSTNQGPAGGASSGGNYGGNQNTGGDNNYSVQDDLEDFATNVGKEAKSGGGFKGDGGDDYEDPILEMVDKTKIPGTTEYIEEEKTDYVLMPPKKLVLSKGVRPAAVVPLSTKQYYDKLDKYIEQNTNPFAKDANVTLATVYQIEKFAANQIQDAIPVIGKFLPEYYPSRNINFEKISKNKVPGSDLGFYDPDEYPEFWGKGPDENDNDGSETIIPGVIDDTNEEFIDFSLISALDKIRANQARRKGLVEDDIIQDNETMELASLPKTKEEFKLNSGGLANLFRVKTQ